DRPFERDRRRVLDADTGKSAGLAGVAEHGNLGASAQQPHVHGAGVAPQPQQRKLAGSEKIGSQFPTLFRHDRARPRPMAFGLLTMRNHVEQGHDRHPSSLATFSNPATSAGGM